MANINDPSTIKHIIDENHYNYLKEKFWEFMENGYLTDIKIITDKDVNYEKKVHSIILQCFCKLSYEGDKKNIGNLEKTLMVNHTVDMIEFVINLLYFGKCIVPVTALPQFMDLANILKITQISVYDERGSDYFVYLMHHKQKLLNYLCYIKKNDINCDMNIAPLELKCFPIHSSILAAYSKKFFHCFRNRIKETNPVLLFLPLNGEMIALTLELCYFGQVTFADSNSNDLAMVANFLGMERFIEKCKLARKKCNLNDENDFRFIKPPLNSKPEIIDKIQQNNSHHYVYLWTKNRCYIFPSLCVQLMNFLSNFDDLKENQYDIIVFLKNISNSVIKKFILFLYNQEFSSEVQLLIDLFGLKCPTRQQDIPSAEYATVNNELVLSTIYASNLDDLRSICDNVFKEQCSKGEKIIQLFTCQTCGEQFLSWRAFKFHCKEHNRSGYLCDECGRFVRPNIFLDHSARHQAFRNNECDVCMKQFPNIHALKHHRKSSSCIQVKCPKCNRRVRKLKLKEHIAKHRKSFQCFYCEQNFTSIKWLKRHVIKQRFPKPIKCLHCENNFVLKCQVKTHIDKYHNAPFTCSKCSENFRSEVMLNKHYITMHMNKRITCSICDKVFTNFPSLKVHERFHSGEEPFKCKFCNEKFGRFDKMAYHIQQVHEKRKYICPVCKNDYTSKSYFLEHGWIHHQKLFDPDNCLVKETVNASVVSQDKTQTLANKIYKKGPLQNDADDLTWLATKKVVTYNCPICQAAFKVFTHLILHLDSHLLKK